MRTGLCVSIVLLALTIGLGLYTSAEIRSVSNRYASASEELLVLVEKQDWSRAEETAEAYLASWRKTVPLLQTLINHEDTDSVTLSLLQLQAAIRAQDEAGCFTACAELRENALHLYHRDGFSWANVL